MHGSNSKRITPKTSATNQQKEWKHRATIYIWYTLPCLGRAPVARYLIDWLVSYCHIYLHSHCKNIDLPASNIPTQTKQIAQQVHTVCIGRGRLALISLGDVLGVGICISDVCHFGNGSHFVSVKFWEWFSLSAVVVLLLGVPNFMCWCCCVRDFFYKFFWDSF